MKTRGVLFFGKYILFGIAMLVLFTYVVMLLWNWLIPELFNGPVVAFWQTLGILILSKILFTGLGHRHNGPPWQQSNSHLRNHSRSTHWRKRFEEKMKEHPGHGPEGEEHPASENETASGN